MQKLAIIKHRLNKIDDLLTLQPGWGVEVDFRSDINQPGRLHISHDAWTPATDFETWLDAYLKLPQPGTIILNTKEDGLESRILEILEARNFSDYFFLDTAVPTLVKWTTAKEKLNNNKFAVRLSAYEPPAFVEKFKGLAQWLWVDCFEGKPVDPQWLAQLKNEFKICLVSPELQGQDTALIHDFKKILGAHAHAVCTKRPELWLE